MRRMVPERRGWALMLLLRLSEGREGGILRGFCKEKRADLQPPKRLYSIFLKYIYISSYISILHVFKRVTFRGLSGSITNIKTARQSSQTIY